MKIKWLGHSCFLITSENGIRILTDPYDDSVGYPVPSVSADIVTSSHNHHDHNNFKCVLGDFKIVNETGDHSVKGINIRGTAAFHDEVGGQKRGNNIIFTIEVDGLSICHCGDLGHVPDNETIKRIGRADLLMLPVGGFYTINAAEAAEVRKQLKPVITFPMHYKIDNVKYPIDTVDVFLALGGSYSKVKKTEIEINRNNLNEMSEIIVLDYK